MTIEAKTKKLIGFIRQSSTQELLRNSAVELFKLFDTGVTGSPLRSPYKQIFHLLGLMLCTPADTSQAVTYKRWKQIIHLLNEITESYVWKFFPGEREILNDEWRKLRKVAMPAFLHYFNTLPLLYREQLIERIETWCFPFDDVFIQVAGISVSKSLQMVYWVENHIQSSFDQVMTLSEAAAREQDRFLKEAKKEGLTESAMRQRARQDPVSHACNELLDATNQLYVVDVESFRTTHGAESVNSFLSFFGAKRGQFEGYFYPTEDSPAELHPLIFAENDLLLCPAPRVLLLALLRRAERIIQASARKDSYYKRRDRQLETKTVSVLKGFLPAGTLIYENVCESPTGDFEHDAVAVLRHAVLVVECKATQQKEPFREPEKAYLRMLREFRSDTGIQKAYEQAEHLRRRLASEDKVVLYDKHGNTTTEIVGPVKDAFSLCITADSFGIVSTDLSLLLEKPAQEPYPWAVSIFDLETILGGFAHENKSVEEFILFLRQRSRLQGQMIATDELEIAGAFLMSGNFDRYLDTGAMFFTYPDMSNIFDDIYYERRGIAQPKRDRQEPVILDAREEFRKRLQLKPHADYTDDTLRNTGGKVGRNDPCPCGSGRKYKKCHAIRSH